MSENCLFCKIIEGSIPSAKVFENDEFVAFKDINPVAPVHILLVPRHHVVSLQDVDSADATWLGKMMALVPQIASENGCRPGAEGGFRVVINSGNDGGQEVGHLHVHIIGGPRPWKSTATAVA
ncbi:histidine triad nucleotide-binding protein [Paenalcaligenes suwonensis]|uniref:histidine triad nucleotide-binding protein n=1 Tax=Paenalcaligenes suwonensis TaxID=1202713 RepID=UPI001407F338|nr:histidine triad nucleotide-binding protein [Paenalcaligenes suwonensis]NHC60132.1 histidine triad nucleotide-binding protein [Paenalcaligenes suwonensis]